MTLNDQSSSLLEFGAISPSPFPKLVDWQVGGASQGPLMQFADHLWTICEWVAGKPLKATGISRATVQHLASVLGRLHWHSSQTVNDSNGLVGKQRMRSNSLRERLDLLKSVDYRLIVSCDTNPFFATSHLLEKVKHCLAIVLEQQERWLRFLSICESPSRDCHWIVRDLWSENILVDDRQCFSSIVDLGASRIDWPGLDFVRLFGSVSYDSPDRTILVNDTGEKDLWNDAFLSYVQSHEEHAIESLDECRMLHKVSLGLSIVQWILWNKEGRFDLSNSNKVHRVTNRIEALCGQMLSEAL
jgi:hypothetical protein